MLGSIKEYGWIDFSYRLIEKVQGAFNSDEKTYSNENVELKYVDIVHKPLISIVVPVYNTPKVFLIEMIESVLNQTYDNLQLCILNGGSTSDEVHTIISKYALKDSRITYSKQECNEGIAKNTNKAIRLAKGDYVALLDHDDLLTSDALMECVKVINESNPDVIYSDEDKVTSDGKKFSQPHHKPNWSPDTLRSYNYICHFLVMRRTVLEKVNLFREGVDGSQDYDLILRLSNVTQSIEHIPKILYHWRISASSTAGNSLNKKYTFDAGRKALENYFEDLDTNVSVSKGAFPGSYSIEYNNPWINSNVTIIAIGEWEDEETIIKYYKELKESIQWANYSLFIINKGRLLSDFKKTHEIKNLKIINTKNCIRQIDLLVKEVKDEFIFIVDSNVKILNKNWINIMLSHANNDETVIIGPKLITKRKIYSFGIALTKNKILDFHKNKHRRFFGYFGRARISQNVSAVSPKLFMFRKSFFDSVDGFDFKYESLISLIDFCVKASKANKYIKLIPFELGEMKYYDKIQNREFPEMDLKVFFEKHSSFLMEDDPFFSIKKIKC